MNRFDPHLWINGDAYQAVRIEDPLNGLAGCCGVLARHSGLDLLAVIAGERGAKVIKRFDDSFNLRGQRLDFHAPHKWQRSGLRHGVETKKANKRDDRQYTS